MWISDQTAQAAAVADPEKILQILSISRQTSSAVVCEAFLRAYVTTNAGSFENKITQARAEASAREWLIDGVLDPVVARFCVLETRRLTVTV